MNRDIDLSVSAYGVVCGLDYEMAILPWGATEPHNLHLPYLTDAILSHDVAVDAAQMALDQYGTRAMVLPPVAMGAQNPGQRDLKFCIHYRQATQRAILADIVENLYHQGIRKLLIVNGHGGNDFKGMIRDLAVDYPEMIILMSNWFAVLPAKEWFEEPGDHADELETSVMMHYHPQWAKMEYATDGAAKGFAIEGLRKKAGWLPRDWSRISADTGVGNPLKASAEKGEKYARAVVDALARLVTDLCTKDLY